MKSIFERLHRPYRFRHDRIVVPGRNARLNIDFARAPEAVLSRADRRLTGALAWLEPQIDVSTSVLPCASRTHRHTGDERFRFWEQKADHYRKTVRDPALRVVLPKYDPDQTEYAGLPDVMDVRPYVAVELLMIDALYADNCPKPDIVPRLQSFDDEGYYGTTHIVAGGLLLLDNGGAPAGEVHAMMEATIPSIVLRNRTTSRADDIFAERCMVLQWMGRHGLVEPAWIMRSLDDQLHDGGWGAPNMPPVNESDHRTVAVATAALAEFATHYRVC
ncbi:hypothetical protein ACEWPM_004165 [Roseovarius sp. S4756]|uniref:hypothetical protein n=1 Tax=Roseovarius maritimus TaxID=3342637 RepID=UPI0037267C96